MQTSYDIATNDKFFFLKTLGKNEWKKKKNERFTTKVLDNF